MADPIQPELHDLMNALAHFLDEQFNPQLADVLPGLPKPARTMGFFLAAFPVNDAGERTDQGRFNYISNADRLDVAVLLREMAARFEGQPEVSGTA